MNRCRHFDLYMAEQEGSLREAIDEDKWYLSEEAGYDVGYEVACENFMRHHLDRFAHEFRVRFCRNRCPSRTSCVLARRIESMPSSRQLIGSD